MRIEILCLLIVMLSNSFTMYGEQYTILNTPDLSESQINSTYDSEYFTNIGINGGILQICTPNGVYERNVDFESEWECKYFSGLNIIQILKSNNIILGNCLQPDKTSRLVKFDVSTGELKPSYTIDNAARRYSWIAQNPININELLIKAVNQPCKISMDFGYTWENCPFASGSEINCMFSYHPYNDDRIFYSFKDDYGEMKALYNSHDNDYEWIYFLTDKTINTDNGIQKYICQNNVIWGNCKLRNITFSTAEKATEWIAGDGLLATHDKSVDNDVFRMRFKLSNFPSTAFVRVLTTTPETDTVYAPGVEYFEDGRANLVIYASGDNGQNWEKVSSETLEDGDRTHLIDCAMGGDDIYMYMSGNKLLKFDTKTIAEVTDVKEDECKMSVSGNALQYNIEGEAALCFYNLSGMEISKYQISGAGEVALPNCDNSIVIYSIITESGKTHSGKIRLSL